MLSIFLLILHIIIVASLTWRIHKYKTAFFFFVENSAGFMHWKKMGIFSYIYFLLNLSDITVMEISYSQAFELFPAFATDYTLKSL